jgi:isoquinoline 1-oxidoreductase beta subunit
MVDPDMVEAQIQSSFMYGLSAVLSGQFTLENGRVQQTNFHDYPVLRLNETPKIDLVPGQQHGKAGRYR